MEDNWIPTPTSVFSLLLYALLVEVCEAYEENLTSRGIVGKGKSISTVFFLNNNHGHSLIFYSKI